MKETNHTDNKLRQLENQSLPDLSRQDEHWQEIKKMLQPGLTAVKPAATGKIWKWIVAACIIGGIAFTGYQFLSTNKKETKKGNTASVVTKPAIEVLDTMKGKTAIADLFPDDPDYYPVKVITTTVGFLRIPPDNTDTLTNPLLTLADATTDSPDKPKATLAEFFAQLEKPSQEFSIDDSRDTVINGNDGTALLIPANTFNTRGKVTIVLKEYYSYEDIITNKLCTTSDGKQLVSGGMIHLTAMADGKEVDMQPGESIRWFIPDTSSINSEMQLFKGQTNQDIRNRTLNISSSTIDTISSLSNSNFSQINWAPQYQAFGNSALITEVKALDLRDFPYHISTGKKTKAFYYMYKGSELSKDELITLLKSRNKWYDKIIIRKDEHEEDWCTYNLFTKEVINCYTSLGDTMTISPRLAKIYKLPVFDTITYLNRNAIRRQVSGSFQANLMKLNEKFSVELKNLGWVNCDRFYNDPRPKMQYFVDLRDTASNYYTLLVFDKLKSMMTGVVYGNKVIFEGVPEGETAKVISVGIKDGKPVAAMESIQISRTTLSGLKFEETTPTAFKEQAATMDK
jgi:hypothetical protein